MMTRYGFTVRTRTGQRVENIALMAATREDAERRLRQMYVQCTILECREQAVVPRRAIESLDIEAVIGLISQGPPSMQHPGGY